MFFVHPDASYLSYIDWRSLGILWTLMVVIQGFKENSVFEKIASALVGMVKSVRLLAAALVFLCFFGSMFITNDVALLTFVPLALMLLSGCGREDLMIRVVVLQTIAANMGSMLTPIGNPQNLYLYGLTQMSLPAFMGCLLPYTLFSALFLIAGVMLLKRGGERPVMHDRIPTVRHFGSWRQIAVYLVLFTAALLAVLRILPWEIAAGLTLITVLGMDPKILFRADYILLLTFIGFFLFTGNIGRIPQIHRTLEELVTGREFIAGVAVSQVISNVPATLLLSGFSEDLGELLAGVNAGGLGTLIASMASLISYKSYANACPGQKGRYLLQFTAANLFLLACLLLLHALL
ncbi:MAG: citrate transporter [Lachnospiraceae bacterium]|nr:citrate transporter [Lachnospiraceae bacterium]